MNDADNEQNQRSVDALLNFETVKYFCAEDHERRRYDSALSRYMNASIKSSNSLSFLNIGQSTVIGLGILGGTCLLSKPEKKS
jgi:ABC-type transport system involved in Fe-S cluster assembly fused permease/ATPase subunit